MKRQEVPTTAMNPGPFLTLILSSRVAKVEDEGWRKVSSDTATLAGATFRRTEDTAEAQSDQPAIVNLARTISGVHSSRHTCGWRRGLPLLRMFCRRSQRRDRPRWQGPTLPRGCVMLVRYASR